MVHLEIKDNTNDKITGNFLYEYFPRLKAINGVLFFLFGVNNKNQFYGSHISAFIRQGILFKAFLNKSSYSYWSITIAATFFCPYNGNIVLIKIFSAVEKTYKKLDI